MELHPETVQDWLYIINSTTIDPSRLDQLHEALQEVEDEEVLYQLALRLSDSDILTVIFPSLSDLALADLLQERNNPKVRHLLTKYIGNYSLRIKLYYQEADPAVRIALLRPVLDYQANADMEQQDDDSIQIELDPVKLLHYETSKHVRTAIIPHLTYSQHKEILEKIVFGDEFVEPRIEAAKLITDQSTIVTLLEKEQNGDVRYRAVENLEDQELLKQLAQEDLYWKVRQAALEKITDTEILSHAAEHDPSMEICLFCIERLDDPNILASLAMNETAKPLRKRAIELIIASGDTDTLMVIAQEEEDPDIQILAISQLTHQQVIFDLIQSSRNTEVREKAISRLTDTDLLIQLIRAEKNFILQRAIIHQLAGLQEIISLELLQAETTGSIRKLINNYLL